MVVVGFTRNVGPMRCGDYPSYMAKSGPKELKCYDGVLSHRHQHPIKGEKPKCEPEGTKVLEPRAPINSQRTKILQGGILRSLVKLWSE